MPRDVSWCTATVSLPFSTSSFVILELIDVQSLAGGISLSPAFVVMFVMQHYQLSWEDALHLVQNRRYCISPNGGFLTQIKVRLFTHLIPKPAGFDDL